MHKILSKVLCKMSPRFQKHINLVGLHNTDESTFRSFFMASLKELIPDARIEKEWHRYDLLIQTSKKNFIVEFKYYVYPLHYELDGTHGRWKGGPGPKNEKEFQRCIQKLRERIDHPIHARFLILAYEHRPNPKASKYSFRKSYGELRPNQIISKCSYMETLSDMTIVILTI